MISPTLSTLIRIEHFSSQTGEQLRSWRGGTLKGLIGKLYAQNFLNRKKTADGSDFEYTLSNHGRAFIDEHLDLLHKKPIEWDGYWTLIVFNIPETKRSSRDRFRRYLQRIGAGNTLGTLWMSPYDFRQQITNYAKELGIDQNIIIMRSKGKPSLNSRIVSSSWNLDIIAKKYTEFIRESDKILKTLSKNEIERSFELKTIIFTLTTIMMEDPKLPNILLPKNWPLKPTLDYYRTKIRSQLYN